MRLKTILAGLVGLALASGPAFAQFPDKPIRIMAPYAPGGNIDVTSRIIADKLKDVLGVTVLVENKAGASGMIGSDIVARSAPDGYMLLVSANSLVAVPAIYGNAPYDWRTAFTMAGSKALCPASNRRNCNGWRRLSQRTLAMPRVSRVPWITSVLASSESDSSSRLKK